MKIQSVRLRLDDRQEVAVDQLSPGLNVIHGGRRADQSRLYQSLAQRLFGASSAEAAESARAVQIDFASQPNTCDPPSDSPAALSLPQVTADDLQLLRQHYCLESLPVEQGHLLAYVGDESCICGHSHRAGVARVSTASAESRRQQQEALNVLERRRQELHAALRTQHEQAQQQREKLAAEDRQLEESIQAAARRQAWLNEELTRLERRIGELESRPSVDLAEQHWLGKPFLARSEAELATNRRELQRWERLLQEVRTSRYELEQQLDQLNAAEDPRTLLEAQRNCLALLEQASPSPGSEVVGAMCNLLSAHQQSLERASLAEQLASTCRTETALSEHANLIRERCQQHAAALDANSSLPQLARAAPAEGDCRCDDHGPAHGSTPSARTELIELQGLRQNHLEESQSLRAKLDSWNTRRAALSEQLSGSASGRGATELEQRLASCERDLAALRSASPEPADPAASWAGSCLYLQRASGLLQELTGGYLSEITASASGHEAEVTDFQGQSLAWASLSVSGRNMVRLSLSLASMEAWERHGLQLPLLLDDPFVHLQPGEIGYVAGVLQRFAHAGRQVLLFTDSAVAQNHFTGSRATLRSISETSRQEPSATVNFEVYRSRQEAKSEREAGERREGRGEIEKREEAAAEVSPKAKLVAELRAAGIDSTMKLLEADLKQLAGRISGYSVAELRRWQHRIALLHFVDDMTEDDVEVLIAAGATNLERLSEIETNQFHQRMLDFLRTEEGSAYRRLRCRYTRARVGAWRKSARRRRELCRQTRYGRRLVSRRQVA